MMPREKLQTSALPKIDSDRLTKLQRKESLTTDVLIFISGKTSKFSLSQSGVLGKLNAREKIDLESFH